MKYIAPLLIGLLFLAPVNADASTAERKVEILQQVRTMLIAFNEPELANLIYGLIQAFQDTQETSNQTTTTETTQETAEVSGSPEPATLTTPVHTPTHPSERSFRAVITATSSVPVKDHPRYGGTNHVLACDTPIGDGFTRFMAKRGEENPVFYLNTKQYGHGEYTCTAYLDMVMKERYEGSRRIRDITGWRLKSGEVRFEL